MQQFPNPFDHLFAVVERETEMMKAHLIADLIREARDQINFVARPPLCQERPRGAGSEVSLDLNGIPPEGATDHSSQPRMTRRIHLP